MLGFAVVISKKNEKFDANFIWKPLFDFQPEHVVRSKNIANVCVEQNTANRFLAEKLWIENDDFFIGTEGVVTNFHELCEKYTVANYEDLIAKMCVKNNFFNEFTGNFAGYIFLKEANKHILFNNHSASKKVFYFDNENYSVFSTDLYTLSKKLNDLKITKSLNIEAAYLSLTSGFMHENLTLIHEVKQLRAGEFLSIENNALAITNFYFHLNNVSQNSETKQDIIEKLDQKFNRAINLEFSLDVKYNCASFSTLSGGLDSRMTTLVALRNGFSNIHCVCFCEKNYADEIIARKIAQKNNLPLQNYNLTAFGLTAIDDVVKINDGLTFYSGAGHSFEALQNYNLQNAGFLHTGMIGDGIVGSSVRSEKLQAMQLPTTGLFAKVKPMIEKTLQNYESEELYLIYNRLFLGENNGFLFYDLVGESSSPFLEPDFMTYALSIPRKWRFKRRIYIDWICSKYPEIANFTWETIGGKPTNNELLRQFYRYKRAAIKRTPFVKTMWKNGMNPEQLWYDKTPEVKRYLDIYFEENIHRAEQYGELKIDLQTLYCSGNITEKTQVLTLLAALQLLFE